MKNLGTIDMIENGSWSNPKKCTPCSHDSTLAFTALYSSEKNTSFLVSTNGRKRSAEIQYQGKSKYEAIAMKEKMKCSWHPILFSD